MNDYGPYRGHPSDPRTPEPDQAELDAHWMAVEAFHAEGTNPKCDMCCEQLISTVTEWGDPERYECRALLEGRAEDCPHFEKAWEKYFD